MIRRPPRSTRTDTLVPYTTLFRSRLEGGAAPRDDANTTRVVSAPAPVPGLGPNLHSIQSAAGDVGCRIRRGRRTARPGPAVREAGLAPTSSEERRVGKALVRQCRSRCSPYHSKQNEILHTDTQA